MDNGDGTVSFDHCDSDDIDELVKVVLTEVSASQPAQPVREPMSEAEVVQLYAGWDCGLLDDEAFNVIRQVESKCADRWGVKLAGIGSKGGAESDVSGTGWVES